MKTRIVTTEIIHLGMLDRLNHRLRNQLQFMVDACQLLGNIQEQGGTTAQQLAAMTADNGTILQLNGRRGMTRLLLMILGSYRHLAVISSNLSLIEEHLNLIDLIFIASTSRHLVGSSIVTADNLILGCLAASLIIRDTETYHVYTHIRRRLVWIATIDTLEQRIEHRINLYITVIVDGNLVVCLQMERVYHVHIVQIGSSSLVCDVHRMLQWEIPHRECLKLGITGTHTTLVLIIKLTQANRHLTAARTRRSNNNQRTLCFNIIVLTEALVRGNQTHVVRIALDEIMAVSLDALALQTLFEGDGGRLTIIMSDDNRTHHETTVLELTSKAQHVLIVCNAQVGTLLVLLYIGCTNHDNNLDAIADFLEHAQFAVRLETRQNSAGMMIVKKFTTQFEVKLSVKL